LLYGAAFKTKKYLGNPRCVSQRVKINCNSSAIRTNVIGYETMKAWFIPEEIANIFSMIELEKKHRTTYDSWQGYYTVHTSEGEVRIYKDENGLLYIDLEELLDDTVELLVQTGSKEAAAACVQMVQQNYKGYTKCKVLQAKEARCSMGMKGNLSKGNLKDMVRQNTIKNCPVTTDAIIDARAIFGPDLPSQRGKTVRKTLVPIVADYVTVPREVVE
jgi:hypothetical protein